VSQTSHRSDLSGERRAAHAHLIASDRPMAVLAARQGPIDPYVRRHQVPLHDGDLLEGLVFHVVGQSISEHSAVAVFGRLRDELGGSIAAPALAGASPVALRDTGLSTAKARTLHELGQSLARRDLVLAELASLDNDAVAERLTTIRGIGPWTAQIFLLYELRRADAFPAWEIGLRKALAALDDLSDVVAPETALTRAERWRPYRSYAAGHLWRSLA
jgi:DNA-3-methyladenine glycosylase II